MPEVCKYVSYKFHHIVLYIADWIKYDATICNVVLKRYLPEEGKVSHFIT